MTLVVGEAVVAKVPFLRRNSLPSAVIGGLIFCLGVLAAEALELPEIEVGIVLRDNLFLVFFAAVGLSIKLHRIGPAARIIISLLILATALMVFQNMVGSAVASAFGLSPVTGLIAGSMTFVGGHGTGAAWMEVLNDRYALPLGEQTTIALATLGLIAGGLLGGPLAERLIARNGLTYTDADLDLEVEESSAPPAPGIWLQPAMMTTSALLGVSMIAAKTGSAWLADAGFQIPGFVIALFMGAVLGYLADLLRLQTHAPANEVIADVTLQVVIVISIMGLKISDLFVIALPILAVCLLQIALILVFVYSAVFIVLGRSYTSALMCAGFVGFGLGATFVGLANMRAVAARHGLAPVAFIAVPIVGSFLIDILNAVVLQLYLLSPVLGVPTS